MNTQKTSQTHYFEGREAEDQFVRSRREADELVAQADEIEAAHRARIGRRAEFGDHQARRQALGQLSGLFAIHATGRERRRAITSHPTYRSLPAAARGDWDDLLHDTEQVVLGYDAIGLGPSELARRQASDLADWDPAAVAEDPAALAALIPRGG